MADEQPSNRDINIQSTVSVSTATDQTKVSGATVKVGSAREVHVHGDTTPPLSFRSVALVGVLAFFSAVLVNIATSQLPPELQPYLWLSWPLALLVTGASIWAAYRQSRSTSSPITIRGSLEQRNRRAMLTKVKTIWIDGLLEQSLAKELRIALDLTEQPDAVELPLNALVQELKHPPRPLPTGTPIIQVFEQMGGALLILGAPGAGKTTLLLELARDLIVRAELDEGYPIPVVFNLSSWATKRQPLKNWLAEELNTKYDVPRKVAQGWMDGDVVLPLLDGLDEVAAEHRGACVEAINVYRGEYGLVPIAVCSRVADYEALTTNKLRLQGGVLVQPLTKAHIDDYLERAGDKLMAVRVALRDDIELAQMLDTPLVLSIVVLTYAETPAVEVRSAGPTDERRRHLFDAYIDTMFQRRGKKPRYTKQQTKHWLSLLAERMVADSLTLFHIEQIQPNWFFWRKQSTFVELARVVSAVVGALLGGLVGALLGGLLLGLFGALLGVFINFVDTGEDFGRIKFVDKLRGNWSDAKKVFISSTFLFLTPPVATYLLLGLVFLFGGFEWGLSLIGVALQMVAFCWILLLGGMVASMDEENIEQTLYPNERIHRSLSNSLLTLLYFGVLCWLSVSLFGNSFLNLYFWLSIGLALGYQSGGRAVIQHYTLRWLLYRNGSLSLRLVPFLDYCAERIFLRKVGGGYIFVHRLLMEHFASLYTEQQAAPPSDEAAN